MGDPKEVGRELNRQYPLGWLIVGRIAMAAVLIFVLVAAGPTWNTLRDTVVPNFQARWFPTTVQDLTEISFSGYEDGAYQALAETAMDLGPAANGQRRHHPRLSGGLAGPGGGTDHRLVCRQFFLGESL